MISLGKFALITYLYHIYICNCRHSESCLLEESCLALNVIYMGGVTGGENKGKKKNGGQRAYIRASERE